MLSWELSRVVTLTGLVILPKGLLKRSMKTNNVLEGFLKLV